MSVEDVVVVGAGPAGSVAARQLAAGGLSVLLLDRAVFPRRKVCGACIGPAAMELLERIGLAAVVTERAAVPLRSLELVHGGRSAGLILEGNLALSRADFDAGLAEAAVAAGARFRDGVTVTSVEASKEHVDVELREAGRVSTVRARVVIDASGLGGLHRDSTEAADARIGVSASFDASVARDLPTQVLRMVVGRSGYVGLVRVGDGSVNVGAAVDRSALSGGVGRAVDRILIGAGEAPLGRDEATTWKGTRPLTTRPDVLATHRIFRIGDAAGYVEPFTGEGMGWAIAGAIAVVPVVASAAEQWSDDLVAAWSSAHRRSIGGGQWLCSGLSALLRRPHLVGAALRVLEPVPGLAVPFVRATGRARGMRGAHMGVRA